MRNFWDIEFPVGDPMGGPAFGERREPVSAALIGTAAAGGAGATAGLIGAGGALSAGGLLSGLGAISAIGSMFSGKKGSAQAPQLSKPTVMPTPDDEAQLAAKRKSLAAQSQRRGRQSTILSDPVSASGDLLGGG